MPLFEVEIDMRPVPKGRPRHTRSGHTFTPAKTREAERIIADIAKTVMQGPPFECPVFLKAEFFFKQAKSNKTIFHTQVPDLDNISKLLQDALNGIVYKDDSQIVMIEATKSWANCDMIRVVVDTWPKGEFA